MEVPGNGHRPEENSEAPFPRAAGLTTDDDDITHTPALARVCGCLEQGLPC